MRSIMRFHVPIKLDAQISNNLANFAGRLKASEILSVLQKPSDGFRLQLKFERSINFEWSAKAETDTIEIFEWKSRLKLL